MTLLITGALGHIGSRLLRHLPHGVYDRVVLLDDLSTQRYTSLFDLPRNGRYQFFQEDICTADFERHLDGVDVVLHLAAITDAESSVKRPEAVERTNVDGTIRLARACAERGCKLLFLSTTSVYGLQTEVVGEDCPPEALRPQSPYASSKLRAERELEALGAAEGLRFVTCRFGTIFGPSPGMRFHTAINKFIWQACTGQPLTVWRTAMHQVRPYLDLTDAVEAIRFILDRSVFDRRIYNVVTLNASVAEVIDVLRAHVPELTVTYVDSPIMNQISYGVDNRRFRELGFTFRGSMEEGVADTLRLLEGLTPAKVR